MGKIITIHSFRGGTGKSNLTANLSLWAASKGRHVGVMDTDIQSPGLHVLFGLGDKRFRYTLNDYLRKKCTIEKATIDHTKPMKLRSGSLHVIPASLNADDISTLIREGYEVADLRQGFKRIMEAKKLDYLFIDTHPGLDQETLLSMATTDLLFVIMRLDQQDFLGTAITLALSKKLGVPATYIVCNKCPGIYDFDEVKRDLESEYKVPVASVIPLFTRLIELGSRQILVQVSPSHLFAQNIDKLFKKCEALLNNQGNKRK
jgi:MinD-like ATPase involved in chromosome partitioning or flagellar assembly